MPAGTITLTNNSATVTGSGTAFSTELKVNDFLVSTVGGVAYTLGVKSIESDTSLTLIENYTGPSASAQSWTPVPYGTMAAITAQLAAQVTYAIRGLNLDKANWQQVYSATGNITVTLPDGIQYSGPSWNSITTSLNAKANTTDVLTKADNLSSVANKATALANLGALPAAGGTMSGPLALNGNNITGINVMNWVSTTALRASLANAGFSQASVSCFDIPGASRTMRIIHASNVVSLNVSGEATVSFPTSFTTSRGFVVVCLGDNTGGTSVMEINGNTTRLSNFDIHVNGQTSSNCRISYVVMGY
ncbi:hypothetical protein [Mixta mediterraneensis]|uniref:hypothetical protein n=1 Tax=Mixta mediterraneensis TaxID=2758443 RepID=UPI0018757105|nr:hypothetical protein [Mixta mediterraneensis]MBE5251830.1 hypothetical protein [Mixta mediterraneensis]